MGKDLKIKSIIFDLGGVVFENGSKYLINYLSKNHCIEIELLNKIFYGNLSWELRKGLISYRYFWDSIYKEHSIIFEKFGNEIEEMWHNSYTVRKNLFSLIKKMKNKVILGTVSGNIKERINLLEKKYSFSKYFDFTIYSFDFNDDKLGERLYKQAVIELSSRNIKTEESIFIDDNHDCILSAKRLSFQTILFTTEEELIKRILDYEL